MKKILLLLFCGIGLAVSTQAKLLLVPSAGYPTIQSAIVAAAPGDTVLVSDGIYYQQVDFLGKRSLTVASNFILDGDPSHIQNTIIDGVNINNMVKGSLVYFTSGEDTTSVLCGFTLTRGKGTLSIEDYNRYGGAIYIDGSGAKIINNRITGNTILTSSNTVLVAGGGIACSFMPDNTWVVIENNTLYHNACKSTLLTVEAFGGAIVLSCNARIENNSIYENYAINTGYGWAECGGVAIVSDPTWGPRTGILANNVIKYNVAQGKVASQGAGLMSGIKGLCINNEFTGNQALTSYPDWGGAGGILVYNPKAGSVVRGNTFKDNISTAWGGGLAIQSDPGFLDTLLLENNYLLDNTGNLGGGLAILHSYVVCQNNVFKGNYANARGGAIHSGTIGNMPGPHMAILVNNTFSENAAKFAGGAIYCHLGKNVVFNSIFWNNDAPTGKEIYVTYMDTLEIGYSNIKTEDITGYMSDNISNFSSDPRFLDPVLLTIDESSPCVNKGSEEFTCQCGDTQHCPFYDLNGILRPQFGAIDQGAYEVDVMTGIRGNTVTSEGLRIVNIPNPFAGSTTFNYTLESSGKVLLRVFNQAGQQVAEPVNQMQSAGEQHVTWSPGILPSGVYYYRIEAGEYSASGKMLISK